ncbi:uncharacterized protein LOC117646223 [Thrips palmi]|uniref:Uncharacterized protein LOC117646223 n=1 Tax=Thrips palmi TaxID=161013 RepID=A0A6P8Z004_THRPL|nr:uncharacterized protein LOC117646223 [Thrips palmi]
MFLHVYVFRTVLKRMYVAPSFQLEKVGFLSPINKGGTGTTGTGQSAATTVALDGTPDLQPEPPDSPVSPEPPEPKTQTDENPEDDDDRELREPGQLSEAELDEHIARGDLTVLADLVLSGEGDRLLSKNTSNPEVQSFLDHVPTYMSKIRAVHDAARTGNLRQLQAALDRRKFAVTAVVRYLAGRFPETLVARDQRGRTALHYAACLADNGHYYNLLLNLGANRTIKDKSGRTADFYLQNPASLTHRQLLADIGEPENIADETFSDKVPSDTVSSRRDVHDSDAMSMMERCFRLLMESEDSDSEDSGTAGATVVEVQPRPQVVAYRDLREVPEAPPERGHTDTAVVLRFMPRHVFDICKRTLTRRDHSVLDVLWPAILDKQDRDDVRKDGNPYARRVRDSYMDEAGFVAPDLESYAVFAPLMLPVIKFLNGLDTRAALRDHPASQFFEEPLAMRTTHSVDDGGGLAAAAAGNGKVSTGERASASAAPSPVSALTHLEVRAVDHPALDLDPTGRVILRSVVHVGRNLKDVRLPLDMTETQLTEVEDALRRALLSIDARLTPRQQPAATPGRRMSQLTALQDAMALQSNNSEYFSLPDIPAATKERLRRSRLWPYIPRERDGDDERLRRLHGKTWPTGRGVFLSGDAALASLVAWVNVHDHFERDDKLGFLLARPWDVGCGVRFQVTARLAMLGRDPDELASLCKSRGLRLRRTLHPEVFLIANKQVLSVSEHQAYRDFVTAMANIIQLEHRAENRSFKLTAVLSRMFKRRPS